MSVLFTEQITMACQTSRQLRIAYMHRLITMKVQLLPIVQGCRINQLLQYKLLTSTCISHLNWMHMDKAL